MPVPTDPGRRPDLGPADFLDGPAPPGVDYPGVHPHRTPHFASTGRVLACPATSQALILIERLVAALRHSPASTRIAGAAIAWTERRHTSPSSGSDWHCCPTRGTRSTPLDVLCRLRQFVQWPKSTPFVRYCKRREGRSELPQYGRPLRGGRHRVGNRPSVVAELGADLAPEVLRC